jgi:hypothetical protein
VRRTGLDQWRVLPSRCAQGALAVLQSRLSQTRGAGFERFALRFACLALTAAGQPLRLSLPTALWSISVALSAATLAPPRERIDSAPLLRGRLKPRRAGRAPASDHPLAARMTKMWFAVILSVENRL